MQVCGEGKETVERNAEGTTAENKKGQRSVSAGGENVNVLEGDSLW